MAQSRSDTFFKEINNQVFEIYSYLNTLIPLCGLPVYASMDIRDAGWKLAAVDVNLFPAGFNNLSGADRLEGAGELQKFFSAKLLKTSPWKIVVVPEAHTNNPGYLNNLAGILDLLRASHCEVRLLWPGDPIPKPWKVKTSLGVDLEYLPREMALEGADALFLNHDMSGGIPKAIQGISLPTFPSTNLGWYRRRKSRHHEIAHGILNQVSERFSFFDSWYLSAQSWSMDGVDFNSESGVLDISQHIDRALSQISIEYKKREIQHTPRVFVKNDSGTYGMGIFTVESSAEFMAEISKLKKKMQKGKESIPISKLIIQESVPTVFAYEKETFTVVGEPSLYLVNGAPIGGFMRIHEKLNASKAIEENLNQPGAIYESLDCASGGNYAKRPFRLPRGYTPCELAKSNKIYGVLARVHMIAAALEECPNGIK